MTLNLYLGCSIRGGRQDAAVYGQILDIMEEYGKVLDKHVATPSLTDQDEGATITGESIVHDRSMEWISMADAVIAEVTVPSLGVGYELGRCMEQDKKVLCLFRADNSSGRKLSAMIRGAPDNCGKFQVKDYNEENLATLIRDFLNDVTNAKQQR